MGEVLALGEVTQEECRHSGKPLQWQRKRKREVTDRYQARILGSPTDVLGMD